MVAYNSERGEVPLSIGGVEIVISATMGGLATVSSKLRCASFAELTGKLMGVEINAVLIGVESLCVRGDVGKALKALSLRDIVACQTAFTAAILHHMKDGEGGNGEAAKGETKAPHGGSGSNSPSETLDGLQKRSGMQP